MNAKKIIIGTCGEGKPETVIYYPGNRLIAIDHSDIIITGCDDIEKAIETAKRNLLNFKPLAR